MTLIVLQPLTRPNGDHTSLSPNICSIKVPLDLPVHPLLRLANTHSITSDGECNGRRNVSALLGEFESDRDVSVSLPTEGTVLWYAEHIYIWVISTSCSHYINLTIRQSCLCYQLSIAKWLSIASTVIAVIRCYVLAPKYKAMYSHI